MNELQTVINPNQFPNVKCVIAECGNNTFIQQFKLKFVSKFQSGNGQPGYFVIPIYVCAKCGCELLMTTK